MVVETTRQFLMALGATAMPIGQGNGLAALAFEELVPNQLDSLVDLSFRATRGVWQGRWNWRQI